MAARKKTPAPDVMDILNLKSSLELAYKNDNAQIKRMRAVREGDYKPPIPEELVFATGMDVRDPTITDEITRVVSTITKELPRCHVTPLREDDNAQKAATRLEQWTEATLWRAACQKRSSM